MLVTSGYDYVVVKDMAYYMRERTHNREALPEGYVHMFLIRHPSKSISSMYAFMQSGQAQGMCM